MPRITRWLAPALLALAPACYRDAPAAAPLPPRPEPTEHREPPAGPRPRPHPVQRHAPEQDLMAEAIAKLSDLTDAMCACTDRACADGVVQEMTRWSSEVSPELKELKPTDDETKEATALAERLSRCMMSAMGP